jgi:hypothetical protein
MSIFRDMMSRIFRGSTMGAKAAEPAPQAGTASQGGTAPGPEDAGRRGGQAAPSPTPQAGPVPSAPVPDQPVDVEAVLTRMAEGAGQRLDWRHSIVDLMKLLGLDSSLGQRKELAQELGYQGALDGSAEMNLWLHRAVMRRLAENGGRVPEDLKG